MDWADRMRYPGLYRLRKTLRSRPRTKLPSPAIEGRTSLMDNVPRLAQPDRKALTTPRPPFIDKAGMAGMAINTPQEGRSPSQTRKTLGGWGEKKFAGDMTTDQFVSLAGALGHAIAPDTPQGRVGSVMSQFGQQEQQRRIGMVEGLRQERLKKEETLRLEDREAKRFRTRSLLGVGKEERGYEHARGMAATLAGAKKAEAEKARIRWEQTQAGVESRFTRQEQRLQDQYGAGKKSGLEGFTYSQRVNFNQEMDKSIQSQLEDMNFATPEKKQFEENRLSIEYQRNMLPGYEPNPNIITGSGVEAKTNKKLYTNWYGKVFEKKDNKIIPYTPETKAAPPPAKKTKTKPLIHPKGLLGQAGRVAISPITESLRGWKNIGDWTGYGTKKAFEFLNKPREW